MRHTGIARDCTSDLAGHNGDLLAVKGLTMLMAGRVEERLLLERTLEAAAGEVPSAVLVHGEAGVGKTRLVTQACGDARARGFTTIWGSCVRVGAIEAPYHPLVKGLEAWAQDASDADRAAVLGSFRSVEEFLAAPERKESTGLAGRLVAIERLVELIAQRSPTVLVLDDLQWADLASRDLLAYLVAGFHRQRLAILGTYRDEGLGQEGMFRGWLADLTRLPAVEDLGLARLTAAETEEQVRLITGSAPHPAHRLPPARGCARAAAAPRPVRPWACPVVADLRVLRRAVASILRMPHAHRSRVRAALHVPPRGRPRLRLA
jgi:predicted ATPase